MRRALRTLGVIALTLILLAVWLRGTDPREVLRLALAANPVLLLGTSALAIVNLGVRAWRWEHLLPPGVQGSAEGLVADLFRFTAIGYALTFSLPGRLGEVARPVLLWSKRRVPLADAFASVIVERLLDVATIAALLIAHRILAGRVLPPAAADAVLVFALCALAGISVGAWVARRFRERAQRAIVKVAAWMPRRVEAVLRPAGLALVDGLERMAGPSAPKLAALSLLTWLPVLAGLHFALWAIDCHVPATATLLIVPLTAVGIAVPTQAGIGGYHAAASYALTTAFGVDDTLAAAAGTVAHAASVVPVLLLGLYLLARSGVRPADLVRPQRTPAEEPIP